MAPAPDDVASIGWRLARFVTIVGALYAAYQLFNRWHWRPPALLPLTRLDQAIPLLPWTVWPYLFLAGCIGLLLAVRRRSTFRRAMHALVIAYPIDLLIFAAFPTTYPRIATPPGDGLNLLAFNFLFAVDTPANCFPSGHITAPLIAFWAVAEEFPRARLPLWLTFAALSVTILTTKQHYVADLLGGLATGGLGLWLSGRRDPRDEPGTTRGTPMPSPRWNFGLWNLLQFQRDSLGFLERLVRECGAVSRCRIAWHPRVIVNDPALARMILNLPHTASNKRTRSVAVIRRICAESVLTADRESWFRLRRIVQPAFHRQQVERHVATMTELSATTLATWRSETAAGRSIDVGGELRRLTFRFIGQALFSTNPSDELSRLETCIVHVLEETWRSIGMPLDLAMRLPTARRSAFRAALASIDAFVSGVVAQRRAAPNPPPDLLSLLLTVRDADTAEGLSDDEVRNECVTLLIAGYDTTANALAWALIELAQQPGLAEPLVREACGLPGQRAPVLDDLPGLRYARAVFLETLRLHPPIWILERNLDAPVICGDWRLPVGTQVLISPYTLHRSPLHWPEAERFDPQRFMATSANPEDNPAYLPFGSGPRTCIGKSLALLEGQVFLTILAQHGSLRPVSAAPPRADAGISLRPRGEVRMRFEPHPASIGAGPSAISRADVAGGVAPTAKRG